MRAPSRGSRRDHRATGGRPAPRSGRQGAVRAVQAVQAGFRGVRTGDTFTFAVARARVGEAA
jgi:hypothetical protein